MENGPFKSAKELDIPPKEHDALIEVLDMLESGKLIYTDMELEDCNGALSYPRGPNLFNMGQTGNACGTPACIGGWVARLLKRKPTTYVWGYKEELRESHPLQELYWNDGAIEGSVTVPQAAQALRNLLQTGAPNWAAVLGSKEPT